MIFSFFISLLFCIQHIYCQASEHFPPTCFNESSSSHAHFWWRLLDFQHNDPCQLAATVQFKHEVTNLSSSCIHYNVLAACTACFLLPSGHLPPSVSELETAAQNHTSLREFLSSFNCNSSSSPISSFSFPAWTQFLYTPIFDPQKAVQLAFSVRNTSTHSTDTAAMTSSQSTSVILPLDVTPAVPTSPDASSTTASLVTKGSSNAGAIAGGIVGAVLFVSLVVIGILYYRRRRIQHRVAPSAEFMFLAGPRDTYARTLSDSPPPAFIERNTSDPVLEKAYLSAEMQRRLDSHDSSSLAWENRV